MVCFKICIVRLGGEAVAGGDPLRRDETYRRSSRVQPPAGGQAPAPSSRESTGCAAPPPWQDIASIAHHRRNREHHRRDREHLKKDLCTCVLRADTVAPAC